MSLVVYVPAGLPQTSTYHLNSAVRICLDQMMSCGEGGAKDVRLSSIPPTASCFLSLQEVALRSLPVGGTGMETRFYRRLYESTEKLLLPRHEALSLGAVKQTNSFKAETLENRKIEQCRT